tara:strand:+ start:5998 stop:6450 length:453 start_codon:yes stop_codon:yes gene_type:complete
VTVYKQTHVEGLSIRGTLHEIYLKVTKMFKSVFAASAALFASAGAALAGPYVNVEANAGWTGSDYNSTTTDLHVGYEGALGENGSYYVQGGASVVSPDGAESDTVPSGKAGLGLGLTDNLGAYGEVSFVGSGDSNVDRGYGTKLGVKYNF